MPFQLLLLLKWHPLRARLCKQLWLLVSSAITVRFASGYRCDFVSAFPAFLDTLLNSSFEAWHSHLFLSNWLFRQAQKNPFPLTFAVTPQESEVQLNGLAESAGGFYRNWTGFWNFRNLPLATKRLLYSWLLFLCNFLWCISFSLALTIEDMTVLKSRGLDI